MMGERWIISVLGLGEWKPLTHWSPPRWVHSSEISAELSLHRCTFQS